MGLFPFAVLGFFPLPPPSKRGAALLLPLPLRSASSVFTLLQWMNGFLMGEEQRERERLNEH